MKQVLHDVRDGRTSVRELPDPLAGPGHIVVATLVSLISAGTERYVIDLAKKSLLGKARQRPDHVRRVLQKLRSEGLRKTLTQVQAKLDEPLGLGYSAAGVVLECGRDVQEFKPGDRVAVAAPHAGVVAVSRNLAARVPEGVTFEQAAYAGVGAIALHGVRLAQAELGSRVLVLGLGLIGQIVVGLLKAQGCHVFGIDPQGWKLDLAKTMGADFTATAFDRDQVMAFSESRGVDAVVIAAASNDNSAVSFAAEVARVRGRVVGVGAVGLDIPREPFFRKGIELTVSSSLGPGRWDPLYEEKGIDYPIGFVRWTAQRNMEATLDMIAAGRLPVDRLTTHRFPIDDAAAAYRLITGGQERSFGVVLEYPQLPDQPRRIVARAPQRTRAGALGVSVVGAGNFARLILLPTIARHEVNWRVICGAKGVSADQTATKLQFAAVATDAAAAWQDEQTDAVFILTRHDLHADAVIAALRAGKHVFVEKPLCITHEDLARIDETVRDLGDRCPILTVGYNRRFSPAVAALRDFFADVWPKTVAFRFAPGFIPSSHWIQDLDVGGGRIIGEATHAIDTCTALTGSLPVQVYAQSVSRRGGLETSDDKAFILMQHADGSVSSISYQADGDRAFPSERIEAFGGGRSAVVDNWSHAELWRGGRKKRIDTRKDKGHEREVAAFLDACVRGGDWPIPWNELYATTWATLAALDSLREGVPVRRSDHV
jgi:predicted dehydrogenase/threonine dehydrogenase-like Zn-dependent dehydrogenase